MMADWTETNITATTVRGMHNVGLPFQKKKKNWATFDSTFLVQAGCYKLGGVPAERVSG
jgi:hypothetical protein